MKTKLSTLCFVTAAMLAPMAVHAADSAEAAADADRMHPRTFVKDSVITTKIKARLAKEHFSSLTRIRVDTHGHGIVVLAGSARTQDEATRALAIARETEGVTSASSTIHVRKHST